MIRITLTLLILPTAILASGPCDLDCSPTNSAGCLDGPADFSGHVTPRGNPLSFQKITASENNNHCDCHPSWTGLECKNKFETCHGLHKCYNGGECMYGQTNGFTVPFCDCKKAIDEEGVRYAGRYCEHRAVEMCDDKREVFCVNGGICKKDFQDHPHRPCLCSEEHDGPHCEFEKEDFPTCDLDCQGHGKCQLGLKNYAQAQGFSANRGKLWRDHENLMHCVCEPGFHGLKCEIESSKCGEQHCFNGGTCVEKILSSGGASQYCDCSTGKTKSMSFSGRYCQYEATSFCSEEEDENGRSFCVNGGKCNETGSHLGCSCPEAFSGPLCEFHDSENNQEYAKCSLSCLNGGKCRKGTKDRSFLHDRGINATHLNVGSDENNEHCVCKPGFVGLQCEHKVEMCSEHHLCVHGARCVEVKGGHKCDCGPSFNAFERYAGKYCEHKATTICAGDGKAGLGNMNSTFCVNDGECIDIVGPSTERKGCKCPDEFEGDHCEISRAQQVDENEGSSSDSSSWWSQGIRAWILVAVAVTGFFGVILIYARRRAKRKKEQVGESSRHDNEAHAHKFVIDDDYGRELEDVSIC